MERVTTATTKSAFSFGRMDKDTLTPNITNANSPPWEIVAERFKETSAECLEILPKNKVLSL